MRELRDLRIDCGVFTVRYVLVILDALAVCAARGPADLPFCGMGKPVNQNGFSDHFPITMTFIEAD